MAECGLFGGVATAEDIMAATAGVMDTAAIIIEDKKIRA